MIDKYYTLIVLETDTSPSFLCFSYSAVSISDWTRCETWLAPVMFSVRQFKLPVITRLTSLVPMLLYNQWVKYERGILQASFVTFLLGSKEKKSKNKKIKKNRFTLDIRTMLRPLLHTENSRALRGGGCALNIQGSSEINNRLALNASIYLSLIPWRVLRNNI